MTQGNKELLIKDLCARLPYGVKCSIDLRENNVVSKLSKISYDGINTLFDFEGNINGYPIQVYVSEIKPYLFPMSSMTEEQNKEFREVVFDILNDLCNSYDWFNANHFDYRGLIDKGLAIDATNLGIYDARK